MLIDTREPQPPPPQPSEPRPRRTWRLSVARPVLLLAGGLALILISGAFSPVPAYVLIVSACILIGRAAGALVLNPPGLRDHRQ